MDIEKRFNFCWTNAEDGSVCGLGSLPDTTDRLVTTLPLILKAFDIKSFNDIGCGDMAWIKNIKIDDYMGYDVVQRFDNMPLPFIKQDCINTKTRSCDMVMIRDVLFHLPNVEVLRLLSNINAKYLFATFHLTATNKNRHIWQDTDKNCGYSDINLMIEPFNLGQPILMYPEFQWSRFMGVWQCKQ